MLFPTHYHYPFLLYALLSLSNQFLLNKIISNYIFTGVNHPTSVNNTFCDDEYSNPSDRASSVSHGVIKGVIFSPNYDNGDMRDIEKCELGITTNINGNRNSFTTLKLVPENDISGDVCLLEMVGVS